MLRPQLRLAKRFVSVRAHSATAADPARHVAPARARCKTPQALAHKLFVDVAGAVIWQPHASARDVALGSRAP